MKNYRITKWERDPGNLEFAVKQLERDKIPCHYVTKISKAKKTNGELQYAVVIDKYDFLPKYDDWF